MNERRIHIDFQKIIDGDYYLEDLLLIYQWVIKLGRSCNKQQGWSRFGLHQSFHGYSYNNEPHQVYPFSDNWNNVIYNGFVNILCRTKLSKVVLEFLSENRIQLGKKRVIKVLENEEVKRHEHLRGSNSIRNIITYITTAYKGLALKKELFQPEYSQRINPRIINNVRFGTNGDKWYAWFTYSFECFDYEPGWDYTLSQNENENITSFFNRVAVTFDGLLIPSDSCDNCPMWVELENHGDFLRHGYRGGCRMRETCTKKNVLKYRWWSDETGCHDNAIHHSIVFPYNKTK